VAEPEKNNILIVGAGKAGTAFIKLFSDIPGIHIAGVADVDPRAEGMQLAARRNIPTATDFRVLLGTQQVDQVIDLTGQREVKGAILAEKPEETDFISGHSARLIWTLTGSFEKIQKELVVGKNLLESVINAFPHPLYVIDAEEYRVIRHNAAADRVKQGGKGRHCYEMIYGREGKCARGKKCPVDSVKDAGRPVASEIEEKTPHGETRVFRVQAFPVKEPDGRIRTVIEYVVDITEEKKRQHAIEESERKYRTLADNVKDIIWIMDLRWRFTYISPAVKDILGYEPEEALKMRPFRIMPFSSFRKAIGTFARAYRDRVLKKEDADATRTFEAEHIKKNGERIPVEVKTSFLLDSKGRAKAVIGITRDISARKKAEKEREESEKRYKTIYETSKDAMMILDTGAKFRDGNPAAVELFGVEDEEELKNCTVMDLSPEYQPDGGRTEDRAKDLMKKTLEQGSAFFEWEHKRKNGQVFEASILLAKMVFGGETLLQATVRDITPRKKAQQALLETVRLKSEFTSMVSHELRTPLTAIKEGIGLVADGTAGPVNGDQKDFLLTAKRNVDRLTRLINDVLDFTKLESGKMVLNIQKKPVKQIVEEVAVTQKPHAREKGLYLKSEMPGDFPSIEMDPDRIIQVLTNLVNNAIKFTDEGGVILKGRVEHKKVLISVKDTGPGIKQEDLSELFKEFRQLKQKNIRRPGGTGLGLSISKKIALHHGGDITVESEYGKGTVFTLILPFEVKRKILAVDDDIGTLDLYRELFEKNGYLVSGVTSGKECLAGIKEFSPDLIVLDLRLPDMNGIEVLRGISSGGKPPEIPVIAITGFRDEAEKLSSDPGMSSIPIIHKPFRNEDLVKKVNEILRNISGDNG
jgi:PAS domain S-box-containing protein